MPAARAQLQLRGHGGVPGPRRRRRQHPRAGGECGGRRLRACAVRHRQDARVRGDGGGGLDPSGFLGIPRTRARVDSGNRFNRGFDREAPIEC